jgi:hypothetical protein
MKEPTGRLKFALDSVQFLETENSKLQRRVEELEGAILQANRMANMLYNYSQKDWVPVEYTERMKEAVASFDAAKALNSTKGDV